MTICEEQATHEDALKQARHRQMPDALCARLADVFGVLADRGRVRILTALRDTELCVCDLSALLNVTPSAVSHQLRILRAARLVRHRKDGKQVFYTLDDAHVEKLLNQALEHLNE